MGCNAKSGVVDDKEKHTQKRKRRRVYVIKYDMWDFMKDCVSLYCELTGTNPQSLPRAGTPFLAPEGRDFGIGCERELNGLVDEAMANFERVIGAQDKKGIDSSTAVPRWMHLSGDTRKDL